MFFDPLYLLISAPAILLSLWASFKVKRTVAKYGKVRASSGLTGAEAASEILHRAGINDVKVERVGGFLSDHYDPRSKVLRLSPDIYGGNSIAALGIAAHEAGHAIQHQEQYAPLILRQTVAPVASFGSNFAIIILMIGLFMHAMMLAKIGVILFAVFVAFTLITLPVEFNASNRARALLPKLGFISHAEEPQVAAVLNSAALTYVAAALAAILQLLYFLLRSGLLGGSSRDD